GLPAYGVCNLGSLNLAAFVDSEGRMDYDSLEEHARTAVRFNDNIIDGDIYIFDGIRKTQLEGERRVGIGTMGLGDALIKMKIRYGSEESLPVIERIYKTIRDAAFDASSDYALEKGAFLKFDSEKYLQGKFIQRLPQDLQDKIRRQGVRNSVILMQAPTGSTSLMCSVTSGIEPVYEFAFTRRDRLGEHKIYHPLYQEWVNLHPGETVPEYFVSANDLTPEEHVKVQAAVQKYVDASISKTVNAPNSHTIEDVKNLYTQAYALGLKGIAYMRDGSRVGVLSREEPKEKVAKVDEVANVTEPTQQPLVAAQPALLPRPQVLRGATYHIATPVGNAFITVNEDEVGNPQELFITVGKAGSDIKAMAEGLGRVISIMLRSTSYSSAIDKVSKIIDQLGGIGGRRSVGFGENRVLSLPDAVAIVLGRHYGLRGAKMDASTTTTSQAGAVKTAHNPDLSLAPAAVREVSTHADICPACGAVALVHEEGCAKCYACGHAEC
ncbi:MAG: ribonucleoside-diphosphate reductase, adenosylcobalamin-dependent, partial [bacterium]|nr:ribonucleoside-diphosphate reductase, adenosylcobalamin-dependent [bacterium]